MQPVIWKAIMVMSLVMVSACTSTDYGGTPTPLERTNETLTTANETMSNINSLQRNARALGLLN